MRCGRPPSRMSAARTIAGSRLLEASAEEPNDLRGRDRPGPHLHHRRSHFQGALASGIGAPRSPGHVGDRRGPRHSLRRDGGRSAWIWVALAVVFAVAVSQRGPAPALRPATLGAEGTALEPPPRALVWIGGALLVALAATPAFAGHASSLDPTWALVPSTIVHVTAMSVWVGGLVMLVAALPAATRNLEPPDRTRLLAACLRRFSPIAFGAVIVLLATGILQSLLELARSAPSSTGFRPAHPGEERTARGPDRARSGQPAPLHPEDGRTGARR